jgi:hypothetical protein
MPDDLDHAPLPHRRQVVAFHKGRPDQARPKTVRRGRIDQNCCSLPGIGQVARNHGQDGIRQPLIFGVALND